MFISFYEIVKKNNMIKIKYFNEVNITSKHFVTPLLTITFFVGIFWGINLTISKIEENSISGYVQSFNEGINQDLEYLKNAGDEVSKGSDLKKFLLSKDNESLISLMIGEKNMHSIGLMGVADADGYVVARTRSINQTGEQASVVSPQGRAIYGNFEKSASIEVSSFDPRQVLMTTGRRIYDEDNKMIGALFANYLLDDKYAVSFAEDHLSKNLSGVNVIFYTNYHGAYGSSFADDNLKKDINLYVNSKNSIIKTDKTKEVLLINNKDYLIKKIPFKGLEDTATGGLIFIPVFSLLEKIILTLLIQSISIAIYILIRHLRKRK